MLLGFIRKQNLKKFIGVNIMKINAICIVKNEIDIIGESIDNALKFCDNIFIFDNYSDDGTYELLTEKSIKNNRIVIAERSNEIFKNQLRNRIYNRYHNLFEDTDWWYILDADELLSEDPKPFLEKADKKKCDHMKIWQAQFYFTDKDYANFDKENLNLPVSDRRRYYRIDWKETRFFINRKNNSWPETESGRIPSFCNKIYRKSPICRHYANRTPYQIEMRRKIRIDNPYSFFHLKNNNSWIKNSNGLFYYNEKDGFNLTLMDKIKYYQKECIYFIKWRVKTVKKLFKMSLSFRLA